MNFELDMHRRSENEVLGNFTVNMKCIVKSQILTLPKSIYILLPNLK